MSFEVPDDVLDDIIPIFPFCGVSKGYIGKAIERDKEDIGEKIEIEK